MDIGSELMVDEVHQTRLSHQKSQDGIVEERTASSSDHLPDATQAVEASTKIERPPKDARFWMVMVALCVACLGMAAEGTITSTALPTIAADLNIGDEYVWVPNAFLLTSAAVQPFFGQTANIFGRRWLTMTAVALFAIGSGISGGATSGAMLIAGRTIQGMGGGGINLMADVIICDLLPMRERGAYMGLMLMVFFVGTAVGPYLGGVLAKSNWRWVFYINLPISGLALVLIYLFLHVKYKKEPMSVKLKRIDYIGNAILIGAVIAILIALSYGGSRYSWNNWRIVLSLVLGFSGFVAFQAYETTKWCKEPTMPLRLFSNRTSVAAFIVTFLHGMILVLQIYFMPLYFQAVLGSSPTRSGVQLLPTVVALVPAAAIGGLLMMKVNRYRPFQIAGFGIMLLGFGLNTLLDAQSSTARWVMFQVVIAIGAGVILPVLLPAVQVELAEADVAVSAGTWAFLRSFGAIWGISIPAAVFNNRFNQILRTIPDPNAQSLLGGGQAYEHVSRTLINTFPVAIQSQIINGYTQAMKAVWYVSLAFSALAFVIVFFEKELKMREEVDTEFGLEDRSKKTKDQKGAEDADNVAVEDA